MVLGAGGRGGRGGKGGKGVGAMVWGQWFLGPIVPSQVTPLEISLTQEQILGQSQSSINVHDFKKTFIKMKEIPGISNLGTPLHIEKKRNSAKNVRVYSKES